ncbi:MAG TPA: hypothetical protein VL285_13515 [Bryobacteraceae bacterium]|jgi:hypothetical protein|nr:hypothetical protein [Bryobacteraceae bacterium]
MGIRILALGVLCVAGLSGQHRRFSWQDYCFNNPASPVCKGREYAVKRTPRAKNGRTPGTAAANPDLATGQLPAGVDANGIDWRFADPEADALAGFDFTGLGNSPLARDLLSRLGASQGLTDGDMQKVFERLSGVDHAALSMRDGRIVAVIVGRTMDSVLLAPGGGLKAAPVSPNTMLVGHGDAVDQALRRLSINSAPAYLTQAAWELQGSGEFWAVGKAALAGSEAVAAGMKDFSLTVSIGSRLAGDVAFEFEKEPDANAVQTWKTTLGVAALEDGVLHVRLSMEPDEAKEKFGGIVASVLGRHLAGLVKAAQYLPVRDANAARKPGPVINGLN